MCEESACLVPPLEPQQHNVTSETRLSSVSNGGASSVSVNGEALVGFHEDALSQANVGRAQLILTIVLGLAVAADCSELVIVSYILPATELHLCIDAHKKGWLVSITLLAMAIGSLSWGILGDKIGRRRALVDALAVAILFSVVATVMPTYGTFMTARFCSGVGIGGVIPLAFSYLVETCPRSTRTRYTGLLHSFWPLGALLTSTIAHFTLPTDGAQIVQDNREHWGSLHKFLLFNIIPCIGCIVGLTWTSESPRYLLEASREVEALEVYQKLHRMNKSHTQYGLTELELPSRSAYTNNASNGRGGERGAGGGGGINRNIFRHVSEAFLKISSPVHYKSTILLASLHLLLGFVYYGVSTYSFGMVKQLNDVQYNSMRRYINDANYTGIYFNSTVENVQYKDSVFTNVTFTFLEFSHVEFVGCDFEHTEFSNVKSSKTMFRNCTVKNCRFIDTDLNTNQHFDACHMSNNTFVSMIADCNANFDYNNYLDDLYEETMAWAGPMLPSLFIIGFVLEICLRPPVIVVLLVLGSLTGIGIFFISNFASVLIVESIIKVLLMCAINAISVVVVEAYPCHLRCTAHGILRSLYHLSSLCAIPIYGFFLHTILLFPALVTVLLAFVASLFSSRIQDNSKVLL